MLVSELVSSSFVVVVGSGESFVSCLLLRREFDLLLLFWVACCLLLFC